MHPNSLSNLKRGGNEEISGKKPEALRMSSLLQQQLHEKYSEQATKAEMVADALIRQAMRGDVPAIKEVFNRIDGPVVETQVNVQVNHITVDL